MTNDAPTDIRYTAVGPLYPTICQIVTNSEESYSATVQVRSPFP